MKSLVLKQQEIINDRFQKIFKLINLLFDMLVGMFSLEPRLVDVLLYYDIQHNGLSLIFTYCASGASGASDVSEGEPPSTD